MRSIHLLIGQRVGDHVLKQLLNRKGVGAIFLAEPVDQGEAVVFKTLNDELAAQPSEVKAFIEVAHAVSSLDHPNIVKVHEVDTTDEGRPYSLMKRIEGRPLGQLVPAGEGIHPRDAVPLLEQICLGLEAGHKEGIQHLRLEPESVLVEDKDPVKVKLLNFGMARIGRGRGRERWRRPGRGVWSWAPEVARWDRSALGAASDVFSLGALAYWMLRGAPPFGEEGCLAKNSRAPEPLDRLRPRVPARAAALFQRCLDLDLARRPASPAEFIDALASAVTYAPVRGLGDLVSRLQHLQDVSDADAEDEQPPADCPDPRRPELRLLEPPDARHTSAPQESSLALPVLDQPDRDDSPAQHLPPRVPLPPADPPPPVGVDEPTIKELPLLDAEMVDSTSAAEDSALDPDAPTINDLALLDGVKQSGEEAAPEDTADAVTTMEELMVLDELMKREGGGHEPDQDLLDERPTTVLPRFSAQRIPTWPCTRGWPWPAGETGDRCSRPWHGGCRTGAGPCGQPRSTRRSRPASSWPRRSRSGPWTIPGRPCA